MERNFRSQKKDGIASFGVSKRRSKLQRGIIGMKTLNKLLMEMSIYVRRAWDAKMPAGWSIPPRVIYDYEILYIKGGGVKITADGKEYDGGVGDLFFCPPGVVHSIQSVGQECVRQPHIHFDFYYDDRSEALDIPVEMPKTFDHMRADITKTYELLQVPYKMVFKNPYEIEKLIQNIILENGSTNPFGILRQKALMFELLYLIFNYRHINKDTYGKDNTLKIVQEANAFMQKNCDRALTTEEIASSVGYSTNYFVELYKGVCFISPIKYHEKLRVEKAKNMLLATTLSVSEIAEWIGFDNLYSFSRFFKRIVGCAPSEFRNAK